MSKKPLNPLQGRVKGVIAQARKISSLEAKARAYEHEIARHESLLEGIRREIQSAQAILDGKEGELLGLLADVDTSALPARGAEESE